MRSGALPNPLLQVGREGGREGGKKGGGEEGGR